VGARCRDRTGGETIARELIRRSAGRVLDERLGGADFSRIVAWFDQGGALKVSGDERESVCLKGFSTVPGLVEIVTDGGLAPRENVAWTVAACELVLEALVARKRISRSDGGLYGRAEPEKRRRRPNEDFFGGGMSA
jgi:magnesium chelatase subunit I